MQKTYHITRYVKREGQPNHIETSTVTSKNIKDALLVFLATNVDRDDIVGPIIVSEIQE